LVVEAPCDFSSVGWQCCRCTGRESPYYSVTPFRRGPGRWLPWKGPRR
jgi:hypothetical protein